MPIHHATIAKAAKFGIILKEVDTDQGLRSQAHWAEGNARYTDTDPKRALAAAMTQKVFKAEYPALSIDQDGHGYEVSITDAEGTPHNLFDGEEVPELADVLAMADELGFDPELGFEEERSGVVVPEAYKAAYAERGNRNHCGDWLAQQLEGKFENSEGKFDEPSFTACMAANGVEMTGKWTQLPESGQRGWAGRYRMNGRQKLQKVLARTGKLEINGVNVKIPQEVLEFFLDKHPDVNPEWI